ncbi:hypothetical protein BGX33_006497 [Mortierella sp. NVP41]|nr:hypothetical protein BGX33_006497 [Mortierella sp. NVP41]
MVLNHSNTPVNPLDLPEILAVVGRFLPLWTLEFNHRHGQPTPRFNPRTLRSCLLVSKLWYHTLFPILWTTYDSQIMRRAPQEIVTRYSPHFRFMSVTDGDPGLFHCTRLVELTVCKFKGLSSQPQAEFQLSPQKPLVRSNPGLRALTWHGRSVFKSLDLEDLAHLENIEDLHLSSWDFENGLLPRLLRMHAGSLRTLHLELANNLNQGELSAPPLKRDNGKDDGTVIHEGYLTMDCLESLTVNAHTPNNQYLSELVRCCPALRELSVRLDEQDDTTLLARSLRNHCPKLDALILLNERLEDALVDLIKNSSARGFRKLHFSTRHGDSSSSPIPIVLLHAATLEDILIRQSYRCIDSQSVFRLFNECPKLKSISICLERNSQNCKDFLDVSDWNSDGTFVQERTAQKTPGICASCQVRAPFLDGIYPDSTTSRMNGLLPI